MEEDPDEEEESPPSFVDHPMVPLLTHSLGDVGSDLCAGGSIGPLKTLKPSSLRFVSLEMTGIIATNGEVRMLVSRRHPTV